MIQIPERHVHTVSVADRQRYRWSRGKGPATAGRRDSELKHDRVEQSLRSGAFEACGDRHRYFFAGAKVTRGTDCQCVAYDRSRNGRVTKQAAVHLNACGNGRGIDRLIKPQHDIPTGGRAALVKARRRFHQRQRRAHIQRNRNSRGVRQSVARVVSERIGTDIIRRRNIIECAARLELQTAVRRPTYQDRLEEVVLRVAVVSKHARRREVEGCALHDDVAGVVLRDRRRVADLDARDGGSAEVVDGTIRENVRAGEATARRVSE